MPTPFSRISIRDILICEDHPLVQVGLKVSLKDAFPNLQHFKVAGTGKEALRLLEEYKPDLAIVDLGLPDMSGIDLIQKFKENSKDLRVLVVTSCDDPSTLSLAKKLNVEGIMRKTSSIEQLDSALSFMEENKDQTFLEPTVASLLQEYGEIDFTPQEYKILQDLVQGLSNPQIAEKLGCSISTVRFHRVNILQKTNIRTGAALRAWFLSWKGQRN